MKHSLVFIFILLSLLSTLKAQNNLSGLYPEFRTTDTIFSRPYIDLDEWRDNPVRHRYVHGGFGGTGTRFSFYFPPMDQYEGRFFQYITPFPDNENLSQGAKGEEDKIGFSIASGAYFIETNGGGATDFTKPQAYSDPTIGAYRANAASAQFSRLVAMKIFGGGQPFGYAFGGSGGAYRTVGGIENTDGVWDGVVPYVLGSPMAIPNVFTVRMHAMRVLHEKFPQIINAMEPGGRGDMYAGLSQEEKEALQEVTRMGFPPESWFGYKTMGIHGFLVLYQSVVAMDRKYFDEDFWNAKGYLGADHPESFLKSRLKKQTWIKSGLSIDQAVNQGLAQPLSDRERGTADAAWKSLGGQEGGMPVAFQLGDQLPDVNFIGGDLVILSGKAAGRTLQLTKVEGDKVVLGPADPSVLVLIQTGDEVVVDNSNFLAVQTYHRHQLPGKEFYVWDQFRDNEGNPLYPQRPMLLGPMFTMGAAGVLPSGRFKGKMILLESLWDREAFPWQADWYRTKVQENIGSETDNNFRLWYTDRALHGDNSEQEYPTRTVSYLGVLQQALRDLSAWVEKGKDPPASTNYTISDGQVKLPARAAERKGIQPVVILTADGNESTKTKAGTRVRFRASVEIPPDAGRLVSVRWDLEGSGRFGEEMKLRKSGPGKSGGVLKVSHIYNEPGTFFPSVLVASQREGNMKTPFTLIRNIGRARVLVSR